MSKQADAHRLRDSVEAAYRAIRTGIIVGTYASGQHVTGEMLARDIGVSRTPVREALRRLHAEGLVRVEPHRGAYVTGFTVADLAQMFALRAVLESHACELATPNLSEAQIDRIDDLAERTHSLAIERPDSYPQAIADANSALHLIIIEAAGNARLAAMIASVTEMPVVLRTLRVYTLDDMLRSAGHHRELARAFRARDPAWAAAVMRAHLLAARRAILRERKEGLLF